MDGDMESPALEITYIAAKKGGSAASDNPHIPYVKTNHGVSYHSDFFLKNLLKMPLWLRLQPTIRFLMRILSKGARD